MAPVQASADWKDLLLGGVLQATEAATFGLPLEVMKTRQASFPKENIFQSFNALKAHGLKHFWAGLDAKVTESLVKGGVFLFSKEYLAAASEGAGFDRDGFTNGVISGAGGGVCQTFVMAPLTYVVTYRVNHKDCKKSTLELLQTAGVSGAYSGASAVAARQASNWALRAGLVNWVNNKYKESKGGKPLSFAEKVGCGLLGGALAAINHPLEVLRIRMQKLSAATGGKEKMSMTVCARKVYAEAGFMGFWSGVIPRIGLSAYQSLFMITFTSVVKDKYKEYKKQHKL